MGFRTQIDVDRLSSPPGKAEHTVFDERCRGLGVRMQGDAKVWLVRYQLPSGQRRKITLGDVVGMPLAEARKQAALITGGAKDGRDPQAHRQILKQQAADTFGALVLLYLDKYAQHQQRPNTFKETKRGLDVYLAPLHQRPLTEITRREVAALLMTLVDTAGPISANRARAALSHCFTWALRQGLAEVNPVVGTAQPAPENKRTRVLGLDELRTIWRAAGDDDYGRIIKLLILTGQRREEVGGMAEVELDRDQSLWIIPEARTKNGLMHLVPLAETALHIIDAPRPGRRYIFGRGPSAPFSGWSQSKARLDQRIGIAPWTHHDLRRSFSTHLNECGLADPHVIEAILNHISGAAKLGVAGIYNRATYRREKTAALLAWAEFILKLTN